MIFTVFGVKVEISVPFCIVMSFLLINDKTGLMSASMLAVFIHESGHLLCMRALNCQPQSVKLSAAGALICGSKYCTASENVLIAISGPIANVLFCLLFYIAFVLHGSFLLLCFSVVQFAVGVMNLLPIKGLDGGTVVFCVLSRFNINAEFVTRFISIVFSCAVLTFGTFLAIKNTDNPSMLLLGIYLIVLNVMKR